MCQPEPDAMSNFQIPREPTARRAYDDLVAFINKEINCQSLHSRCN